MMKRAICCILVVMLLMSATAFADVPKLSSEMLSTAKQALSCLGAGEYERLVTMLPYSDVAPSADEWQSFAQNNFTTLGGGVQTEYAVAYWTGSVWKLAVPVSAPSDGTVETLVLSSADGSTFNGYRYADWSQVQEEYESASYVSWDSEYIPSDPVVAAD